MASHPVDRTGVRKPATAARLLRRLAPRPTSGLRPWIDTMGIACLYCEGSAGGGRVAGPATQERGEPTVISRHIWTGLPINSEGKAQPNIPNLLVIVSMLSFLSMDRVVEVNVY